MSANAREWLALICVFGCVFGCIGGLLGVTSGCSSKSASPRAGGALSADERRQIPGVIAFVSERGPDRDIWLITPTGQERQLTAPNYSEAPGGEARQRAGHGAEHRAEREDDFPVAFRPGGEELMAIATREVAGTHLEQLRLLPVPDTAAGVSRPPEPVPLHPPRRRTRNPSFAADGSFFVAESSEHGFSDLVRMAPDAPPQRLTESRHGCFEPSVSPDGKHLAFVSSRDGNPEVYLMDLATRTTRRLTNSDKEDGKPAFSPDGQWLAFMSRREGRRVRVFITRPDGTDVRPLSGDLDTGDERELAWRPDSAGIAFVGRQKDGVTRIYRADIGASARTVELTDGKQRDDQPAWSPDGKYLVYVSDRQGETDLYLMRADGTGRTRLTRVTGADWLPRWSPPASANAPKFWPKPTKPDPAQDPITARAREYQRQARTLEPSVTSQLQKLANERGGALVGLEHRFKSEASLHRKITDRLAAESLAPSAAAEVVIDDALRYTMVIDDQPAGRYTDAVRATLAELEKAGHKIERVKNYWPSGDNYSGVNVVLKGLSGLVWELQFHTSDSKRIQDEYHGHYRELRARTTSPERKRELYDQMAAPWEKVAIPERVLTEKSLHDSEEIIKRPRP